jgi:hypothetical protein
MEQPAEWRQLDLLVLATSASQHQRLDPNDSRGGHGAAQVAYRRMQRRPRKGEGGDR